ncbi:dihydrofolate reductase family protein [Sphingomonas sp. BAUL-RG-20F-R05-02]|uniref:dihydrofolate reductase family protein n=1 Tax=Sphingomonas sp. BAUL-RG-20F-R05-02 TaxID=2914830 RepID=UPI001F57B507|nr:dihydrofolate reductase family protein [Sphingomonas sp. BAUL-RG-20F-R05-02]
MTSSTNGSVVAPGSSAASPARSLPSDTYPGETGASVLRKTWLPRRHATAYAIVADTHGKIAWGRSDVGVDPIVVLPPIRCRTRTSPGSGPTASATCSPAKTASTGRRVRFARSWGSNISSSKAGGHINGAFLRAGLVDEISLMIVPAIDGAGGAPVTFDGPTSDKGLPVPLTSLTLQEHELIDGGILWLRYSVE